MKKTMIALATIAAVGAASAQGTAPTITPYGVIDLNVNNSQNGTTIGSGGYSTSRFGVKGEVKVDGLTFDGLVETGVNASNPAATTLGNRGANLGVTGSMGTIRLGRQFTPYAMSFFNDATQYDGFSPIWWGGFNNAPIGHTDRVWQSHSVSYTSPTFSNFNFVVLTAPGADGAAASTVGSFDPVSGLPITTVNAAKAASSYVGVGLNYAPVPELALSYGWESYNTGTIGGAATTAWNLGAAFKTMGVTLYADVNRAENGAAAVDNGWMISAAAPVSGTWSLQGGYSSNESAAVKSTGLTGVVLNDIHKQVRLYAGFARSTLTAAPDTTTYLAGAKYSF